MIKLRMIELFPIFLANDRASQDPLSRSHIHLAEVLELVFVSVLFGNERFFHFIYRQYPKIKNNLTIKNHTFTAND